MVRNRVQIHLFPLPNIQLENLFEMVQEGFSFILLLGAGALLLRPGDFPLFARAAGRVVGLTVRSIRTTKESAEKAITHTASVAHQQNPDMVVMRENLKQSLEKFHDLTNTVRRDIADVPLNPASLFTDGFRSWDKQVRNLNANETSSMRGKQRMDRHTSMSTHRTVNPHPNGLERVTHSQLLRAKPSIEQSDSSVSGGDLLSRAIEEHALALQKQRLFPQADIASRTTVTNGPTNDSTDA